MKKLSASMLAILLCFCMVLSGCDSFKSRIQERKNEREESKKEEKDTKDEDKEDKKDKDTKEPSKPSETEETETSESEETTATTKETEPEESDPTETTIEETEETKETEETLETEETTKESEPSETTKEEITEITTATETKETGTQQAKFDRSVYDKVLLDTVNEIVDFDEDADEYPEDYTWINDEYWYSSPQDLLINNFYTYYDINDDGIEELFIISGQQEFDTGVMIHTVKAVYTIKNDKPTLLLSGWSRNLFIFQENGGFFNSASMGAFSSCFGDFVFDETLDSKDWKNFYFTDYDENDEIYTYYNKIGVWDVTKSEKVEDGAIWDVTESYAEKAFQFNDGQPLEEFALEHDIKIKSKPANIVIWELDKESLSDDDIIIYGTTSKNFVSYIEICTDATVYNLEFLKFSDHEIDDDGNITFSIETVDTIDSFSKLDYAIYAVEFPEYLPYYGISYTNYDGSTAAFSLNMSGEDGSIYLAPITIN